MLALLGCDQLDDVNPTEQNIPRLQYVLSHCPFEAQLDQLFRVDLIYFSCYYYSIFIEGEAHVLLKAQLHV